MKPHLLPRTKFSSWNISWVAAAYKFYLLVVVEPQPRSPPWYRTQIRCIAPRPHPAQFHSAGAAANWFEQKGGEKGGEGLTDYTAGTSCHTVTSGNEQWQLAPTLLHRDVATVYGPVSAEGESYTPRDTNVQPPRQETCAPLLQAVPSHILASTPTPRRRVEKAPSSLLGKRVCAEPPRKAKRGARAGGLVPTWISTPTLRRLPPNVRMLSHSLVSLPCPYVPIHTCPNSVYGTLVENVRAPREVKPTWSAESKGPEHFEHLEYVLEPKSN
ncbi:hypothetical protein B0H16DRAFT_1799319 [Mycena metata]|uniref:Uncharacterized protein n=1 Tax=Mycena metata TaxID=1033252 RepID=A0AAD7MHC4_9AGAR|nr:hypothetical protein B0H16DRAFT_1799319 [Mycena metata]